MAWRNDRSFYHRKSDLTGKQIISIYPEHSPFTVYHQSEWYSDQWDPMSYGKELDLSRPFLDQFAELMHKVPRLGMDLVNCDNSDYCNYCGDDKNCYLDIAGEANENCYFCLFTKYSKDCLDCTFAYHSTLCHESIQVYNCYGVRNSQYLEDCSDCLFCFDCKGCRNCALSVNLRNKEYCIMNEQHTKEEYERKMQELKPHAHTPLAAAAKLWKEIRLKKGIYRDMYNLSCDQCTGNDLKNSKQCRHSFNATNCEDSAFLYDVLDAKDCRDLNYSLYKPELAYELISTLAMRLSAFTMASHYNSNVFYCDLTNNSHDLFGCIGLNHKEYCILNKQYTKEEYEDLVPKIIAQMHKEGSWGEFFPAALSPFGYNETVAQEYVPLSKEDVVARGWQWSEQEASKENYLGPQYAILESIDDIPDDICEKILICERSGRPYKIIPQELKFYRTLRIPIPRHCPAQRHEDRNLLRNPRRLWSRTCAKCQKRIETTYAPERPEIVYCESCYLSSVY